MGSNSRAHSIRVSEHKGVGFRTGQPLSTASHSNIRDHTLTCGTTVEMQNFSKLATCQNTADLRILESLYIDRLKPKLNPMQTAHPLYVSR